MTGKTLTVAALPLLLGLTACGDVQSLGELESYVAQVRARPGGDVKPLPPVPVHTMPRYAAAEARNPFVPVGYGQPDAEQAPADSGVRPDPGRPREELEQYPLDSLAMVGTFQRGDTLWGLVQAPDGVVHRVHPGNHLGTNYGRIVRIDSQRIDLVEIVANGMGGWTEQNASMAVRSTDE